MSEDRMIKIKIATLNVRGLNDYKKQNNLNKFIKEKNYDVTLIQETHFDSRKKELKKNFSDWRVDLSSKSRTKVEQDYQKKQIESLNKKFKTKGDRMKLLINPAMAQQSEGVMTALKAKWKPQVTKVSSDGEGRYIISEIKLNTEEVLIIINLYAPTSDQKEQDTFFDKLTQKVMNSKNQLSPKYKKVHVVAGGDFNSIENKTLDKRYERESRSYSGYKRFKSSLNLTDIFRDKNPDLKSFTYRQTKENVVTQETRIDRFLISHDLRKGGESSILDFNEEISGDHSVVELEIMVATKNIEDIDRSKYKFPSRDKLQTKKSIDRLERIFKYTKLGAKQEIINLQNTIKEANELNLLSIRTHANKLMGAIEKSMFEILKEEVGLKEKGRKRLDGRYGKDYTLLQLRITKNEVRRFQTLVIKEKTAEEQLKEERDILNERLRKAGIENIREDYSNTENIIKLIQKLKDQRVTEMKNNQVQAAIDIAQGSEKIDQNQFWRRVKGLTWERANLTHIVVKGENKEDIIIDDPELILNKYWPEFWQEIYSSKKQNNNPESKLGYMRNLNQKMTEAVNTEFNEERYHNAKERQKNFKSPGESNVPMEAFRALSEEDDKIIQELLKIFWTKEFIPDSWKSSIIQFIEKPGDITRLANWRPITLLEVTYKIFTGIIYDILKEYIEKNHILNDLQFGFRQGRSLSQALMTCFSAIEDSNQFENPIHILKLDFSKAFDSMERWVLMKTLKEYKVPDKIRNLVEILHEGNTATMFTPLGIPSKKLKIERGIRQGDVLSPLLFIIFINPLLDRLTESGLGYTFGKNKEIRVPCVCFADDLTLIAKSPDDLKEMMKIVEEFCKETGMTLNTDKCEYTNKVYKKQEQKPLIVQGKILDLIPHDKATKLLGVEHNLDCTWEEQENKSLSFIESKLGELYSKIFTLKQKVKIINMVFTPKIRFAMNVIQYSNETLNTIDDKYVRFLRKVTASPWNLQKEKFFDPTTLNLDSIRDEQEQALTGTIINSGWNGKGNYPRKCLEQRSKDQNRTHVNITRTVAEHLGKHGMAIESSQGKGEEISARSPLEAGNFFQIKDSTEEIHCAIFTDGSYDPETNQAGSAVIVNNRKIENSANIKVKTRGNQTPINAELEATLIAYQVAPEGGKTLIFSDCLSAIKLIEGTQTQREKVKGTNTAIVTQIQILREKRKREGAQIELLWIPSHSLEKELNENKKNRLRELKERFGKDEEQWNRILYSNRAADTASKLASKEKPDRVRIPKEALPYVIIEGNSDLAWQGDISKRLKNENKKNHRERLEKQLSVRYGKNEIDRGTIQDIFQENGLKYNKIQRMLFRLMTGGLYSPNNRFEVNYDQQRFEEFRKRYLYPTDKCELETCQDCVLNTNHLLFQCETVQKTWDTFLEKINKDINDTFGINLNLQTWFDREKKKEKHMEIIITPEITIQRKTKDQKERSKRKREEAARKLYEKRQKDNQGKAIIEEHIQPEKRARDDHINDNNKRKQKRGRKDPDAMDIDGNNEDDVEENEEPESDIEVTEKVTIDKLDRAAIEEKITTDLIIEKRKLSERQRKTRVKKKKALTSLEMGNKGFVNKELNIQIEKATNNKKKQRLIKKEITLAFISQVREIYLAFWDNHFKHLRENEVDTRKLTRSKKTKDITIT